MNNRIIIADFTGDQINDVLIISENDGKNNIRILTYENGKLKEIWKDRNNRGLIFGGDFLDGFKANIENKKLNYKQNIDLSNRKEDYITNLIYDNSGKLLTKDRKISSSGLIQVETVKLNDRTGVKAIQLIYGIDNNDILDEIGIVWKYSDGKWQLVEVKGLKFGNLLY